MRIGDIIYEVRRGKIKLPAFQRPEIWNRSQVLDLLDSIRKGYPIGHLLLWRTQLQLTSDRNIGGFQLPDPPTERDYVLDGQQRITAIFATLTREPRNLDDRYQVLYDLQERVFVPLTVDHAPWLIEVHQLFDPKLYSELNVAVRELPDSEQLLVELYSLYDTMNGYEVPVTVTDAAAIDDVGIIFERINRQGTALTLFDLMVAATWAGEADEFNLREQAQQITESLAEEQFDDIEGATILRCMSAIEDASARRKQIESLRHKSTAELRLLVDKTKEALRRSVDFLSTSLNVHANDMLPYERQLVAMSYFMAENRHLTTDHSSVLEKWFWRSAFAERYRGGGEALFDDDLQTLQESVHEHSKLDRFGSNIQDSFFIETKFQKNSAAAKAYAALLGKNRPVNLTNGIAIDVGYALSTFNRKEFHHIFPKRHLKNVGTESGLVDVLANICMQSASENKALGAESPSIYLARIRESVGQEEFLKRLESNLISSEAATAALTDNYAGFLEIRSRDLANKLLTMI